jgi:ankyrin repeat protein
MVGRKQTKKTSSSSLNSEGVNKQPKKTKPRKLTAKQTQLLNDYIERAQIHDNQELLDRITDNILRKKGNQIREHHGYHANETYIQYTCRMGHSNELCEYIKSGCDTNILNDEEETLLHIAYRYKRILCIEVLLAQGLENSYTILKYLVKTQNAEMLKLWLQYDNGKVDTEKDYFIYNVYDNVECVSILAKAGWKFTTPPNKKPLIMRIGMIKSMSDLVTIYELGCRHGLVLDEVDKNGDNAILKVLVAKTTTNDVYHSNHQPFVCFVKSLIEHDVPVINSSISGATPLMFAIQYNCKELVDVLIGKGQSLDAKTLTDDNIISYVTNIDMMRHLIFQHNLCKHLPVNITTLVDHGIILRNVNDDDIEKTFEMLDQMIDAGVSIDPDTFTKKTMVMWAAEKNNIPLLDYFIEKGISVNAEDDKGDTALYYACSKKMRGHLVVVHNAIIDRFDHEGRSLIKKKTVDVCKQLIQLGGNPRLYNYMSHPYFFAELIELHLKVVKIRLLVDLKYIALHGITSANSELCRTDDLDDILSVPANLFNIPFAQLIDALQLYIYGKYPDTHPLSLYVKQANPVTQRIDEIEEIKKEILLIIESISGVIHMYLTQTKEGNKQLEKMANADLGRVTKKIKT